MKIILAGLDYLTNSVVEQLPFLRKIEGRYIGSLAIESETVSLGLYVVHDPKEMTAQMCKDVDILFVCAPAASFSWFKDANAFFDKMKELDSESYNDANKKYLAMYEENRIIQRFPEVVTKKLEDLRNKDGRHLVPFHRTNGDYIQHIVFKGSVEESVRVKSWRVALEAEALMHEESVKHLNAKRLEVGDNPEKRKDLAKTLLAEIDAFGKHVNPAKLGLSEFPGQFGEVSQALHAILEATVPVIRHAAGLQEQKPGPSGSSDGHINDNTRRSTFS